MISALLSRLVILVLGTLYPAYASYKAVKTKNVKEYVKWMMYWIVFALFTCVETFADMFISWLPFYYEIKVIFVLWLMCPATKGASILYRKFVHPQLVKRELEIDSYIAKVSDEGYSALRTLGTKGFNYAANIVVNTAMKGQTKISDHLKKSYSMNDVSTEEPVTRRPIRPSLTEEDEDEADNRLIEEQYNNEMNAMQEAAQDSGHRAKQPRTQSTHSNWTKDDTELYSVEELAEMDQRDAQAGRGLRSKKTTYAHNEAE